MEGLRAAEGKLLAAWLLLLLITACCGQGLPNDGKGSAKPAEPLEKSVDRAQQWKKQVTVDADEKTMLIATAPDAYDLRNTKQTGGLNVLTPVADQGDCNTCTAFAVGAAAETALAYGLKQDASEWFSQQDFFFCRGLSRGQERSCASNWSLEKALTVLAATPPTTPKCLPYTPFATNRCAYKCPGNAKPHPDVTTGKFWFQNLGQPADAQQWIRQHGPVLTSMKLYKEHLFSFLEKTPGGIYRGPVPQPKFGVEQHAVVLVGYNNEKSYWVVRSSWGPSKGEKGYIKVAYSTSDIANADNTWGLRFVPTKPVPAYTQAQVSPSATKKGCQDYKATDDDYFGKVAVKFGMSVKRLVSDNMVLAQSEGTSLAGKTLVVCVKEAEVAKVLPPTTQAEALLKIKAAVDPNNILRKWVVRSDASQPYAWCAWPGITCDGDNSVTDIYLTEKSVGNTKLGGVLPDADVLLTLPKLQFFTVTDQNLAGTLPDDYSKLVSLKELSLQGNKLRGTLPAAWAGMSLQALRLGTYDTLGDKTRGNSLEGTLPAEWGKMAQLRDLTVIANKLRGPLPGSWGSLRLDRLQLASNQLTGTLPDSWAPLAGRLNVLDVSSNSLQGTLPKGWTSTTLRTVALESNQLEGPIPSSWAGMSALVSATFSNNQLTGSLPTAWASKTLTTLALDNNRLSGPLPAWPAPVLSVFKVGAFANGRCAGRNAFSGPIPADLAMLMPRLTVLQLPCNKFSGTLPPELGGLTDLTELYLGENPGLKGPLPSSFGKLSKLTTLDITGTGISGTIPESMGDMASLKTFDAQNTKLSGCVPSKWGRIQYIRSQIGNLQSATSITGFCP